MVRKSRNLTEKKAIAIYCEGESEVQHFNMLARKYHGANVHTEKLVVQSLHKNGLKLLIAAVAKRDALSHKRHVDQVYVVFDRDELSDQALRTCQQYAQKHQLQLLFSSINFEIWILLHFEYFGKDFNRQELYRKLSGTHYFAADYQHFKGHPYDAVLYDRVQIAIQNATKLSQKHADMIRDRPFTNIHRYLGQIYGVTKF
jgi:hypothetical protein